jgi:hypothetical protein
MTTTPALPPGMEALLDTEQAAAVLGLSPESLRTARSTRRGDLASLPYHRVGCRVKYSPEDLRLWLHRRRVEWSR